MMLAVMKKAYEVVNTTSTSTTTTTTSTTVITNTATTTKVDNDDSQGLWDYFLLMGHDTLPIVTLPYMEAFLTHTNSGINDDSEYRGTNFIYCWEVSGHSFFGQWEDNTW